MSRMTEVRETGASYPATLEERQAVLEQMERILASVHFRQSKRYPVLLRYVVERTLQGRGAELKERTLGVEVFQRHADYDTNDDPVVRITAGEVRKRIAQYYQTAGHVHEPRIDLPPGSYVPQFRLATKDFSKKIADWTEDTVTVPVSAPPPPELTEPANFIPKSRRFGKAEWVSVALVSGILLAASVWYFAVRLREATDAIWTPLFSSTPLLISIGEPSLIFETDASTNAAQMTGLEHLHVDYLVFSDVQALTRLTSLLDTHRQLYRLLPASATTYADLRQGPAVLLGGFDNPWTMRATSKLRFRLARRSGDDRLWIEDEKDPQGHAWAVNFGQRYNALVEDYALVARFLDPDTQQPVIIVAGIGENGTIAASEFITDGSSEALRTLKESVRHAGAGKGQNFEAVIKTQVINGVSGPPHVIAEEIW